MENKEKVNPVVIEKNVAELLKILPDAKIEEKIKSQIIQAITDLQNVIEMQKRVAILMEANITCENCVLKGKCINQKNGMVVGGCVAEFILLEQKGFFGSVLKQLCNC